MCAQEFINHYLPKFGIRNKSEKHRGVLFWLLEKNQVRILIQNPAWMIALKVYFISSSFCKKLARYVEPIGICFP